MVSISAATDLLASTGSSGADFVPLAIGAVLLLLAGVALAVTRRISRHRHHHHPGHPGP